MKHIIGISLFILALTVSIPDGHATCDDEYIKPAPITWPTPTWS